jgi:hypothetical protein
MLSKRRKSSEKPPPPREQKRRERRGDWRSREGYYYSWMRRWTEKSG